MLHFFFKLKNVFVTSFFFSHGCQKTIGLGIVYSINFVLAIFAAFKAEGRGQPAVLWIGKVLTVGGLAFDQFTQLPTLEEVEAVKARKGKRALKNKNNRR